MLPLQNYFTPVNWNLEMLVGHSQQEMVMGHMAAAWQSSSSTASPETLSEKFHFQKKTTSSLAKSKCLTSQAVEEKEPRSSSGANEHDSVTAFGRS